MCFEFNILGPGCNLVSFLLLISALLSPGCEVSFSSTPGPLFQTHTNGEKDQIERKASDFISTNT
jgi:hypothetical protein